VLIVLNFSIKEICKPYLVGQNDKDSFWLKRFENRICDYNLDSNGNFDESRWLELIGQLKPIAESESVTLPYKFYTWYFGTLALFTTGRLDLKPGEYQDLVRNLKKLKQILKQINNSTIVTYSLVKSFGIDDKKNSDIDKVINEELELLKEMKSKMPKRGSQKIERIQLLIPLVEDLDKVLSSIKPFKLKELDSQNNPFEKANGKNVATGLHLVVNGLAIIGIPYSEQTLRKKIERMKKSNV
jgi:hypothetical protein